MRAFVGHPVDVVTGGVFTAWHDFAFPGRTSITWRRFYSTGNQRITGQGRGWTTPYFTRLERVGDRMELWGDEGHAHHFADPVGDNPSAVLMHGWSLYRTETGYRIFDRAHSRHLYFVPAVTQPGVYLLEHIEELSGHRITMQYDDRDLLLEMQQPSLQRRLAFRHTAQGLIERIELLAAGMTPMLLASYEYDEQWRLTAARDPAGAAIRYAYDDFHRLVQETNKLGYSFHFDYDDRGRCIHTWGDGGYLERRLRFHSDRQITEVTDSAGAVKRYTYGRNGAITAVTNALGHTGQFNRQGGVEQRVDAEGWVAETEYSERGELLRRTDALGQTFSFTYNDRSQITSITDPGGAVWQRTYDERGLLRSLGDPAGNEWTLERGAGGEVITQIDPEGRRLRRRYDPLMRWQEIADDVGYYRLEYDIFGRPVVAANADGVIATWRYDAVGRLVQTSHADGSTEDRHYDANGNVVSVKDRNNGVWTYHYDGFGHLTRARDPLGNEVVIEYDSEGRRTRVRNQNGDVYEDTYDAAGRVVERRFFDGTTERYTWSPADWLRAVQRSDGTVIERSYDPVGNLTEEMASRSGEPRTEPLVTRYEYDWRGNVTTATNPTCATAFEYDPAGHLLLEKQDDVEVAYAYDRSGKLVGREVNGGGGPIALSYDAAGLIASVADARGVVAELAYGRSGSLIERKARGHIEERLTHDVRGRLATQTIRQAGKPIIERRYRFDAEDNLVELFDGRGSRRSFLYDQASRLTAVFSDGAPSETFQHDASGNIVAYNDKPARYGMGSRLKSLGAISYEYDASGRQSVRKQGGTKRRYEYDAYGRLIGIHADTGPVARYGYDALNRRVWKTDAGNRTTRYVWSNRTLAAIVDADQSVTELLISGRHWLPTMLWKNGQCQQYICNHNGLPQEVVSEAGRVTWRAEFTAFGKAAVTSPNAMVAHDLRFPGQIEDRESGLFYNWNRYYDPEQGRYLTPDPAGIDAGLNLYDYPRDPINWTDPLGLSCPNPKLVEENQQWGWQIHEHDDGTLTITADCTRGFATPKPGGLRATIHAGDSNKYNPPEAHLGQDGRLIVMEGTHRSVAASRGQQMPPDPDNPHLGGVPGRPGHMTYEYSPDYNDDQPGVPLQSLNYPPGYPHKL